MLYLLWALINLGLFVFFIVICFSATKYVKERINLFGAVVFVLGLLSFTNRSNSDNEDGNTGHIKSWRFIGLYILQAK
jgi:hypothetical protein